MSYYANSKNIFTYNYNNRIIGQYFTDPIFVVINENSFRTGEGSTMFWTNSLYDYFYFLNQDEVIQDLKDENLYQYISCATPSIQQFNSNLDLTIKEIKSSTFETILCIMLAIILYRTMNSIYFEEFEKELFIKRISGMQFIELYGDYLKRQIIIFCVTTCLSVVLFHHFWISIASLTLFIVTMFIVLYFQSIQQYGKESYYVRN